MGKIKRTTKIVEALNSLNKTDIYSLMLFTLFKLHDDPEYTTLSELCYLLDNESLSKLFNYYGGMTVTIPTVKELKLVLASLSLFEYVRLNKGTFEEGIKGLTIDNFTVEEVTKTYQKLVEVVSDYEFSRD